MSVVAIKSFVQAVGGVGRSGDFNTCKRRTTKNRIFGALG